MQNTLEFGITGMTCAACSARIERALKKTNGVLEVHVNLATERANIAYTENQTSPAQLRRVVRNTGYGIVETTNNNDENPQEVAREQELVALQNATILALTVALPLVMIAMLPMIHAPIMELQMRLLPNMNHWNWIMLGLATITQFGPGWRYYRHGWPALRALAPDMNTLVMIGTSAAYFYSLVVTVAPTLLPANARHVYFESSAVVIALVLLGKYLETRAKGRTSQAIRRLVGLQARSARVLNNNTELELPIADVLVGDTVVVRPGERIPSDGTVTHGTSFVDESMISGESTPVQKTLQSKTIAGSINHNGLLHVRVDAVGKDTVLSQIVALVENAQRNKPALETLANSTVAVFTPVVMVVATLTALTWMLLGGNNASSMALVNTVAVLIVACPCALGLATPISILVGTGKGAEHGVLFTKGNALEELAQTQTVAFDKTGTLTKGQPELTDIKTAPGFETQTVLQLVASLENNSEHPIATAVLKHAQNQNISLLPSQDFRNTPGMGIEATIAETHVLVGTHQALLQAGIKPETLQQSKLETTGDQHNAQGKTTFYVAINQQPAAVIAVADPIKPEAHQALKILRKNGQRTILLSGDNPRSAHAIGAQLGFDPQDIHGGLLPADKTRILRQMQDQQRIAFVGDGINDAPALTQANVGIAIGSGTDIAIHSSDVVLISGDLRNVPNAIALAKATTNNIRFNLFWAFAYNVVLIPVAAGVLYPSLGWTLSPVLAASAMALSSVFVIGNALRLRGFKWPMGENQT